MAKTLYKIPKPLAFIIFICDFLSIIVALGFINLTIPIVIAMDYSSILTHETIKYYSLFSIIILMTFFYRGHYSNRVPYWQQILTITKAFLIITAATLLIYFVFSLDISLYFIIASWIASIFTLSIGRTLAFKILNRCKNWKLPVTLLGDNQMIIDCMYSFYGDGQTGFLVKTIMLRDKIKDHLFLDAIPYDHPDIETVDASGEYLDYILNNPENLYIIDMEGLRGQNRDRLIALLEQNNIDYAIVPSSKRLHLYGMKPLYFFGNDVMILHRHKRTKHRVNLFFKRLLDIVFSCALMPLLAIFTFFIYIYKKKKGVDTPIFYGGYRLGKNGTKFPCWKFNTMRNDADKILNDMLANDPQKKMEWDKFQKLTNDPRIDSTLSSKLRKSSLDELPQIWNVFKGDMSFVGPRPILPEQTTEYGDYLHLYTELKPGITGLWQVSGRNNTTFEQRIYWDGWYAKNWSLWNDIVILIKTVSVIITKKGAS